MPRDLLTGWFQFTVGLNPVEYILVAVRTIIIDGCIWEHIVPGFWVLLATSAVLIAAATSNTATPRTNVHPAALAAILPGTPAIRAASLQRNVTRSTGYPRPYPKPTIPGKEPTFPPTMLGT